MGGSSGGGGTSSTVTSTAIPDWQQGQVQANENIANSLASQPYQTYQGQTIAGFSPLQQQGMDMTQAAATAGQPALQQSQNVTNQAAGNQWNAQTAQQYMSPYAQAALQPQIQALQIQQGQNANNINARATQAGAYGDAQYGNEQALNNFFGGQNLNNLEQQGMNTAYTTGQNAFNANNQKLLAAGSQLGNISNAAQQQGLAGASAVFNSGTQQQQLDQSQLTAAYNNFINQQNYPYQELNARIAATANSQYQVPTASTSIAPTSSTAQNIGAFGALAGGVGSLLGGSSGGSGGVYGGATSDRRVKKAIKEIGKLASGIKVYKFKYNWEPEHAPEWIGVMADEVEKIIPDAVHEMINGLKWVDYAKVK